MLGNYITEWDGGKFDNTYLLDGPENSTSSLSTFFADKLIQVAKYYKFDGWFFNIESALPNAQYAQKMKAFLEYMTAQMHKEIPGSLVIWYDSVTHDGSLKWQNALNEKNKM